MENRQIIHTRMSNSGYPRNFLFTNYGWNLLRATGLCDIMAALRLHSVTFLCARTFSFIALDNRQAANTDGTSQVYPAQLLGKLLHPLLVSSKPEQEGLSLKETTYQITGTHFCVLYLTSMKNLETIFSNCAPDPKRQFQVKTMPS